MKREIQQRVDKHLAQNEARKLTKEQKHEKLWNKQEKDLANGIHTTVYKIDKLVNPKHLFKLNISAQEENLVGVCLKNPKFNLVIVEGGEKSIGHYKKLMMKRIKWTENVSQSATKIQLTIYPIINVPLYGRAHCQMCIFRNGVLCILEMMKKPSRH